MATIDWGSAAGGDWATAADWSGGVKPGSADTADIAKSGTYTVTVDSADAADDVNLDSADATLAVNSGGVLKVGSTLDVTAGALQLNSGGTISGGVLTVGGGSVDWNGGYLSGVTYEGVLDLTASAKLYGSGAGLTVTGAGGTGAGVIDITGSGASLSMVGFQTLDNATVDLGGTGFAYLYEDDPSEGGATLTLGPGLQIDQTGQNVQIDAVTYAGGDSVLNEGSINAAFNTGEFIIDAPTFTNQGVVTVSAADFLDLDLEVFANNAGGQFDVTDGGQLLIDPSDFTNAGTISATGGTVTFEGTFPGPTGVLTGGTYVVGAGATFELPRNEPVTAVDATLVLSGAGSMMESLQTSSNTESTVDSTLTTVGAGGVLELLAGRAFNAVKFAANAGAVDVEGGSIFEVRGTIDNTGTIAVASTTATSELRIVSTGATLTGGGQVTLTGSLATIVGAAATTTLTNVNNTISGIGRIGFDKLTLDNETAGKIEAAGAGDLVVETKGETLINAGLMEATAGSRLYVEYTTVAQTSSGTILAATGASVYLDDADVVGGKVRSSGTGEVYVDVAGGELNGASGAVAVSGVMDVVDGSNLVVDGAIDNGGTIELAGGSKFADLIVGANGASLTGGGEVSLADTAGARLYGQSAADTLTNVSDRIVGAGLLGNGEMGLVNDAGGVIDGDQSLALIVNTGASTIVNTGLMEAAGGVLDVDSAVSGVGSVVISGGGKADFASAFSQNVAFGAGGGELVLAQATAYAGTLSGFSTTGATTLDLTDIGFGSKTKATFSGTSASGVLTVTDGTNTARIALTGDYAGSTWTVASDGDGGTTVVDPASGGAARQAPGALLITAMAAFPRAAAAAVAGGAPHPLLEPILATPR